MLIGLGPPVDFVLAGTVAGDGSLDETERYLQVAGRLGSIAAVVADGSDDLPDILTGSHQPRPPAGGALGEPDQWMLIHAQTFFDVPLREGARCKMHPLGVPAQARDSRIVEADA